MTPRERVLALLPEGVDGVVLENPGIVSWYLGGARTSVPLGGSSVVAVLVTRERDEIRCHIMEADRLAAEEGVTNAVPVAWTDPLVPDEWRRRAGIRSEGQLETPLRAARASLTEIEADRYRALGSQVARAVTTIAAAARPNDRECDLAGALADAIYCLGAEPVVLLVAGAARAGYRHPLPTPAPIGDSAMLVVGARRRGLIVNLTRWVRFRDDPVPGESALRAVEADVLDATAPGASLSSIFATLQASYLDHGFSPEQWRSHHQGGPTGYLGRDPKVTPRTSGIVAERQAFAWNPSAHGTKMEDTVLATSGGIELLTHDPAWPSIEVAGRRRPLTLYP